LMKNEVDKVSKAGISKEDEDEEERGFPFSYNGLYSEKKSSDSNPPNGILQVKGKNFPDNNSRKKENTKFSYFTLLKKFFLIHLKNLNFFNDVLPLISTGLLAFISNISFEGLTFFGLLISNRDYTILNFQIILLKFLFLASEGIIFVSSNLIDKASNYYNNAYSTTKSQKKEFTLKIFTESFYLVFFYSVFVIIVLISFYSNFISYFTVDRELLLIADNTKYLFLLTFGSVSLHLFISGVMESLKFDYVNFISCVVGKVFLTIYISLRLLKTNDYGLNGIFFGIIFGQVVCLIINISYLIIKLKK